MSSVAYNSSDSLTLSFQSWGVQARTSQDPPFMSLSHSCPCCLKDLLDVPGSSLGVPSDTVGSHAVLRITGTSQDPPFMSLSHSCPLASYPGLAQLSVTCSMKKPREPGPLGHRLPCCTEDRWDILGSSLGVPSDTGSHAVLRI